MEAVVPAIAETRACASTPGSAVGVMRPPPRACTPEQWARSRCHTWSGRQQWCWGCTPGASSRPWSQAPLGRLQPPSSWVWCGGSSRGRSTPFR
eukprot:8965495-Alexandrium_andersonii.AAC.1